jgi:hypothetical protein
MGNPLSYLVDVGKISTDVRYEFMLLSDVLGLFLLVDSYDHPPLVPSIMRIRWNREASLLMLPAEKRLFAICSVKDTQGRPIPAVSVDAWETDSKGLL